MSTSIFDPGSADTRTRVVPLLQSTQGRLFRLEELRGSVVVLFYEAKGHTKDNEELKQVCGELAVAGTVEVLGVAQLEGLGFARRIVTKAVQVVAARYGTELFLDFHGALKREPYFLGDGSSVAILDERGDVVFRGLGVLTTFEVDRFLFVLRRALVRCGRQLDA